MQTIALSADHAIEGSVPLYADLMLLSAERHGALALAPRATFGFAAAHPLVPLTLEEFERAALDYPIVFFGALRRAFAVTSITEGRNEFIDDAGDYCGGAYVPAYLRRHPFVMVKDRECDVWVLAVDEAADSLCAASDAGARPLFDGATPTETTREVLAFCEQYEAAQRRTDAVGQLLDELGLFETQQAHYQPRLAGGAPGDPILLFDYAAISRERFEALDADGLARLRQAGALGPLYAHLISAANWDRLALIGTP